MTEHKEACCTFPTAVCYWFTVSLAMWGVLSLIGSFGALSMRCRPPRSFSPWQSAAFLTGLGIAPFTALSLGHYS